MLGVLDILGDKFNSDDKLAWSQHHVARGFTALEKLLKDSAGRYATGDEPLLADVFLAPQVLVAIKRFQMDMVITLVSLSYPCEDQRSIHGTACIPSCPPRKTARCTFLILIGSRRLALPLPVALPTYNRIVGVALSHVKCDVPL
ncbi:glutathione S-transferase zeta class-like isoform X1 [Iris pallida]|uniref:Glutathione S-transferase zeta class-like isoform X1 n=1 Tax=Iris pallida TaxID=29817 RepID=A0AAX6HL61_IRIPA|nr:glutathione S-transferase zeta class-like isoform X1 [Iris pallida]